jgi:hypothetical protein
MFADTPTLFWFSTLEEKQFILVQCAMLTHPHFNCRSTVRPWDARFLGNGKTRVAQKLCKLSYLIRQRQEHQKPCSLSFSLHKFVHLKFFWPYSKTCIVKVHAVYIAYTVGPWDARFWGNGKTRVAQNSCNLS